ncbi:hypothetical protein P175DRAFT_0512309 [Aspergillus ochraceoroseus IBT 24754]|nr:uncharacterized protein P175DRAFT_0512309 [Aspergillus ochraceoroseus IBT 24754]PTU17595.1 hypothetical protein P175DRAFT_0512309 [Aspergillus ochraceoroseus IBT 24754]
MASWSMGSNDSCQNKSPTPFKSPINRGTFSDKDEFAVRSLLALGTGAEAGPEPVYDAVSGINTIPYLQNMDHKVDTPLASSAPNKTTEVSCPGAHSGFLDEIVGDSTPVLRSSSTLETGLVTETQRLKLLQHYRYHVAPWLDICDLKHAFGIAALQMAVHSERLLSVLLALSKICIYKRSRDFQMIHSDDFGGSHTPELPSDRQSLALHADFTETLLVRVFQELHYLVSDVSHAWRNINGSDYGPLQSLVDTAYGLDIDSAVYWMFFRLDLGKALANNTPIRIQLPSVTIPSLSLLCRTDDAPERVAHYTQALLWMCGKALIIGHRESIPPQRHQLTDTWLNVFEELNQWRHSRPQEFYPMVELNGEDPNLNPGSQFPLLLFTNGAAALCNQLYHTAMLLLLECKPRTTLLNNPHSPVLSSLWHAQRVCGIALNNDRRECWDPCLLASFLVAARYMTHESQQQEIVEGFDRIQEITGWGIGEYLTQLREEWSFLEGGSNELQEIR